MRLAWFAPRAPSRSGIVRYSDEVLPALARDVAIDVFDQARAHEFVWRHFTDPYALTVYQLGNAAAHDYMWPYLMRYPGLTVLHDAQLHQSRAAALLKHQRRAADYRTEFAASEPDAPPLVAELVIHGLAGELLHFWPLTRLVVSTARTLAVHNEIVAASLSDAFPAAHVEAIPMGVPAATAEDGASVRARHDIPTDAVVFAAIGRVTPEKRIGPALRALAGIARDRAIRILLAGETADYYDVEADARACGVRDRVTIAGYVSDEELDACIAAADVCLCLRWPSNGETSASWLRCLAAGKPTVITDLAHQAHVPSLDPRTWAPLADAHGDPPIAVSIDILDEDHSLGLAVRRLASDEALRAQLGARARDYWRAHHTLDHMASAYRRVIARAAERTAPPVALPAHLTADGTELATRLAREMGVDVSFLSR